MQANAQRAQFVFSFFYGNGHCHILYVCIYGQTLQTLQAAHCEADSCPNLIKQSLLISHLYMWLIVFSFCCFIAQGNICKYILNIYF